MGLDGPQGPDLGEVGAAEAEHIDKKQDLRAEESDPLDDLSAQQFPEPHDDVGDLGLPVSLHERGPDLLHAGKKFLRGTGGFLRFYFCHTFFLSLK